METHYAVLLIVLYGSGIVSGLTSSTTSKSSTVTTTTASTDAITTNIGSQPSATSTISPSATTSPGSQPATTSSGSQPTATSPGSQTATGSTSPGTSVNTTIYTQSTFPSIPSGITTPFIDDMEDDSAASSPSVPPLSTPVQTMTTSAEQLFNCSVSGNECENNGTCTNMSTCECGDHFAGDRCELRRDCTNTSCENGGICDFQRNYGFKCECPTGDQNANCALNTEFECQHNPPVKDQWLTCIEKIDGFEMICSQNYSGKGCSVPLIDDFCSRKGPGYCSNIEYCKPLCNVDECNGTSACNFTVQSFNDKPFSDKMECIRGFADGYDIPNSGCDTEELMFDGFDKVRSKLEDCSPYFETVCTAEFGDEHCNELCNNTDCLQDGWDCVENGMLPPLLSGGVVLELMPTDKGRIEKVLGLLLRSLVRIEEKMDPVPHAYLSVRSTEFTQIQYVGKFLAAAFAKLPDLLQVKDVFVCENGTYSAKYDDKCSKPCSKHCKTVDDEPYCDWQSGNCLQGCEAKFYGPMCSKECPDLCSSPCEENGRCTCMQDYYWSSDTKTCVAFPDNCVTGMYGKMCENPCSTQCKNEVCDKDSGECSQGCNVGYYGNQCQTKCPIKCPECAQDTGDCNGKCIDGYEGDSCRLVKDPPPSDSSAVIIALVVAILIIIIIVIIACCWRRRQSGDYVLEDEEMESPVKKATTLEANNAVSLQPIGSNMGQSTDMIDLDEKSNTGVYTGPPRQTGKENETSETADNGKSPTEGNLNGDVIVTSEAKNDTVERVSLTIDIGESVDSGESGEPAIEIKSNDDDLMDGANKGELTIMLDVDVDKVQQSNDEADNGRPEVNEDTDTESNVPLSKTMAPLASEEDILLSKENLLVDEELEQPAVQEDLDGDHDDKEPSSRKSSTSSKSSSSSSSSNHSAPDRDKQSDTGELTTEM